MGVAGEAEVAEVAEVAGREVTGVAEVAEVAEVMRWSGRSRWLRGRGGRGGSGGLDGLDGRGLGFMPTMVPGVVEQAYSLYRLFLQDWESGVILPALGNWEGETYCAGSPEDAPRLAAAAARLLHVPPPELEGSFVPPGARASPRGDFYAVEWGDLLLVVLTSLSYTPTCHALGVRDSSNMQACMERDMAEAEKQKEMDGDGGQELGTVISEKKGAAHEAPKMFNEELIALEDKPSSGERRESSDQLRPGEVGEELSEEVGGEVGEELSEEVGEEVGEEERASGGNVRGKVVGPGEEPRQEEAMDLKARQVGGDEGWERGQEESEEVGWVDGLSDCSFEAEANDTDFTLGAAQQVGFCMRADLFLPRLAAAARRK
ncbi:hypothetical protein CYMTET_36166, partial [Cymbomonas tetramitiformis]